FRLVTSPVRGSIWSTVLSPLLATHTPLGPLAMATGTLPTGMVCTTVLVVVLIRDTVASPLLVTHASWPVTVTADGSAPTGTCCTTAWVAGCTGHRVPLALSAAQTAPCPWPRPAGPRMLTGAPTRTPCELIRLTLLPGRLVGSPAHGRATATMPAAAATASAEPIASKR